MFRDPSLVFYADLAKHDGASFMSDDAYGHLCTVTGATWQLDGRKFNGSSDKITIPHTASLNLSSSFTFLLWVKASAQARALIGKGYDPSPNELSWLMRMDYFVISDDGAYASANRVVDTGSSVDGSTWELIGGRFVSGSSIDYLRNGTIPTTMATAITTLYTNTRDVLIGSAHHRGGTNWFDGVIRVVMIYNRALTLLEIQNHFLATKWRYA